MKMVWETRRDNESEEERLADRLARRETEAQRRRRIARRQVDPQVVAALRRLWAA